MTLLAFLILLPGCSSGVDQKIGSTLPAPQVRITRVTASSERGGNPSPVPLGTAASATPHPPVAGSLAEMASQVYGGRLVSWVRIPALTINAPVTPVGWQAEGDAQDEVSWDSPDAKVGWAVSSALPGDRDNIILYGHNNIHSSVFLRLSDLTIGDEIILVTGEKEWHYRVDNVKIIPVTDSEQDQMAYLEYFAGSEREQLTLLSCWPPVNNTHRVIVQAFPVE